MQPMDTSLLPWHDALWQNIWQSWQQDRMPHALLLNGAAGMGKRQFALALARFALCVQPTEYRACGQCKSCHLFSVGSHPDFVEIAPEEAGKPIKVDQIRDLIEFCNLTTQYGRYRVVMLAPAEAMNTNAANSLLKLLEEPPPRTLLLLISHQPARLPATIRSRCQRLLFSP